MTQMEIKLDSVVPQSSGIVKTAKERNALVVVDTHAQPEAKGKASRVTAEEPSTIADSLIWR